MFKSPNNSRSRNNYKNIEFWELFREFKISNIAKNEELKIFEFQNVLYEITKYRNEILIFK